MHHGFLVFAVVMASDGMKMAPSPKKGVISLDLYQSHCRLEMQVMDAHLKVSVVLVKIFH